MSSFNPVSTCKIITYETRLPNAEHRCKVKI